MLKKYNWYIRRAISRWWWEIKMCIISIRHKITLNNEINDLKHVFTNDIFDIQNILHQRYLIPRFFKWRNRMCEFWYFQVRSTQVRQITECLLCDNVIATHSQSGQKWKVTFHSLPSPRTQHPHTPQHALTPLTTHTPLTKQSPFTTHTDTSHHALTIHTHAATHFFLQSKLINF